MASALERIPGLTVELKILSKIYFNIYLCICLHELCMCTTIVPGALDTQDTQDTQELQLHTDG